MNDKTGNGSTADEPETATDQPDVEVKNVTGRTAYDAVVVLSEQLGRGFVLIVFLTLLGYGFYYLQKINSEYNEKLTEQILKQKEDERAELKLLSKELRDTYTSISTVGNSQIQQIKDTIALKETLSKETETQRQKLDEEIEKKQARIAELDKSIANYDITSKRLTEVQKKNAALKTELETIKKNYEQEKREKNRLKQRLAAYSSEAKESIKQIAKATTEEERKQIVNELYEPEMLLAEYAQSQSKENFNKLESLVDIQKNKIEDLLRKGLGYKLWFSGVGVENKNKTVEFFVGVAKGDEYSIHSGVVIIIEDNVISDIEPLSFHYIIRANDYSDWRKDILYGVYEEGYSTKLDNMPSSISEWNINTLFENQPDFKATSSRIIYGKDTKYKVMTLSVFKEKFGDIFKSTMDDDYGAIKLLVQMNENEAARKQSIDKNIIFSETKTIDDFVRNLSSKIINKKDISAMVGESITENKVGRLNAVFLRSNIALASQENYAKNASGVFQPSEGYKKDITEKVVLTYKYESLYDENFVVIDMKKVAGKWIVDDVIL